VEAFLTSYREQILAMTAEELGENVTAVVEKLLERPKNVDQEGDQLWVEVKAGTYWFERKNVLARVLKREASVSSLLSFYDSFVAGPTRVKFSSQFYGKGTTYVRADVGVRVVGEPSAFRRSMGLMPVPPFAPC
jgi:secreted Zn-dependent insulinase-like peptidase